MEVSEDVPAEAVARERAAFVSRCTERLARAAAVLGPGRDCRAEDRASEGEVRIVFEVKKRVGMCVLEGG